MVGDLNQNKVADAFLGSWDLTTITLLETGPWLTPSISPGDCELTAAQLSSAANGACVPAPGTGLNPNANYTADQSKTNVVNRGAQLRPDVVSQHFYTGQSRRQFFNPQAFSPSPFGAGRIGNAGVGILQ